MRATYRSRTWTAVVLGGTLATVAGLGTLAWSTGTPAVADTARTKGDVVVLRCTTTRNENSAQVYQKSNEAPAKRSNDCAQVLSDTLRGGYAIEHAAISEDAEVVIYTLVR